MLQHERSPEQLATAEQADDLLRSVEAYAAFMESDSSHRVALRLDIPEAPAGVAAHFPEADSKSVAVGHTVELAKRFIRPSELPRPDGERATITFRRTEKVDEEATYHTDVKYQVVTHDDGVTYGLMRRITAAERGPRSLESVIQGIGERSLRPELGTNELIQEIDGLRAKALAARQLEEATGMVDVTQSEARQVIDFTKQLIPKS